MAAKVSRVIYSLLLVSIVFFLLFRIFIIDFSLFFNQTVVLSLYAVNRVFIAWLA